jgi:hypothetical protein
VYSAVSQLSRLRTVDRTELMKVCLVVIESLHFDYAKAFESAFEQLGADAEVVRVPFFLIDTITNERLRNIIDLLREKSKQQLLIFCPGTQEWFLDDADYLFVFSAYRSWWQPQKFKVLPHVWSHVTTPPCGELTWTDKPPLRVGFMGADYMRSRLVQLVLRLPLKSKKWLLHGYYLKHARLLARLYQFGVSLQFINAFVRAETLRALDAKRRKYPEIETEIVVTDAFTQSEQNQNRYVNHLKEMTYIVCPRGVENFSFRVYEALRFGRIPVIIDTEMVLPDKIDWKALTVHVPFESLENIYEIILHDYTSRTPQQFLDRQKLAFATMNQLSSMSWLRELLCEVTSVAN